MVEITGLIAAIVAVFASIASWFYNWRTLQTRTVEAASSLLEDYRMALDELHARIEVLERQAVGNRAQIQQLQDQIAPLLEHAESLQAENRRLREENARLFELIVDDNSG